MHQTVHLHSHKEVLGQQDTTQDIEPVLVSQEPLVQQLVPVQNESKVPLNPTVVVPPVASLRKSQRTRRPTLSSDYVTYLTEVEYDFGDDDDPTSYKEALESSQAPLWYVAMQEELSSMEKNGVWSTLIEGSNNMKPIRNKWFCKTKRDSSGKY